MAITIKRIGTEEEIKGKAFVHWSAWHEAYSGIISQDYLDRLTLEKCEQIASMWTDNILIAKENDRVIGFVGYGSRGEEAPDTGEIFALYTLSEFYGKGVGLQLMNAGLEQLKEFPKISLLVLKENKRAIRFYQKCGFMETGEEIYHQMIEASEIRMLLER